MLTEGSQFCHLCMTITIPTLLCWGISPFTVKEEKNFRISHERPWKTFKVSLGFFPNQNPNYCHDLPCETRKQVHYYVYYVFFFKWDHVVNSCWPWSKFTQPHWGACCDFSFWLKSQTLIRQRVKGVKMDWLCARIWSVGWVLRVSSQDTCLENQLSLILWYLWYFLSTFLIRSSNLNVVFLHNTSDRHTTVWRIALFRQCCLEC